MSRRRLQGTEHESELDFEDEQSGQVEEYGQMHPQILVLSNKGLVSQSAQIWGLLLEGSI